MKKLIIFGTMLFTCAVLFAQQTTSAQSAQSQTPESEEIELPEVTTVIKGESIKAGLDALPDFADVLEPQEGSSEIVPVLPEVEIGNEQTPAKQANQTEKDIYAEGQVGGGFPSLFLGDFSVYRQSGVNPFNLTFHHDSAAGYAGKALTEGFNNRNTSMSITRTLNKLHFNFNYGGKYVSNGLGLQNQVENISAINNDMINAYANGQWELKNNLSVGVGSGGYFYTRYTDIVSKTPINCPPWVNISNYDINPFAFLNWCKNSFALSFTGQAWLNSISSEKGLAAYGDFGLNANWGTDVVTLYGNSNLLFGNPIEGEKVLVPFTAGLSLHFPTAVSSRLFLINLEGGLNAGRNTISGLENMYKFTCLDSIPDISSEWFGKIDLSIPVKSEFTLGLYADYFQTAYDNGRYVPVYTTPVTCGLYGFEKQNVQELTTKLSFTYHYKLFSITGAWHSNWMDVPALETAQAVEFIFSLQSEESKWGTNLSSSFGFGEGSYIPVVNLDCFIRATSAVRVLFAVDDIVSLCSGKPRVYAGQYVAQGGSASLLVKFFF